MEILTWRQIVIDGVKTNYAVHTFGWIKNLKTGKILKPFLNPSGYYLIDIFANGIRKTCQVHRLVAKAYIPNPSNLPVVNHIDGNKLNNSVYNLEWCTIRENIQHGWRTGLMKPRFGVDNPSNVYTEDQTHAACKMLSESKSDTYISEALGVNITLLRDIKFRNKWSHISSLYDINKTPVGHKEIRNEIIDLIKSGENNAEIMQEMGMNHETKNIRHIDYVRSLVRKSASTTIPFGSTPEVDAGGNERL